MEYVDLGARKNFLRRRCAVLRERLVDFNVVTRGIRMPFHPKARLGSGNSLIRSAIVLSAARCSFFNVG